MNSRGRQTLTSIEFRYKQVPYWGTGELFRMEGYGFIRGFPEQEALLNFYASVREAKNWGARRDFDTLPDRFHQDGGRETFGGGANLSLRSKILL